MSKTIAEVILLVSLLVNVGQWMALSFYKGYYDQKQRNRKMLGR